MSWINIADQLPPMGELVWVIEADGRVTLAERAEEGIGWTWAENDSLFFCAYNGRIAASHSDYEDIDPVMWHPLPKLPEL